MVTITVLSRLSAIFLLVCLILLSAYPAIAIEATKSTTAREKLQERIDAKKAKVDAKKEAVAQRVETVKEKMATREAALKAKLEKFKDKKKAEVVERANTNLNQINENQTSQMLKHLDKMSALLSKLESKVGASGAYSDAKTSIASASSAVKAQAEKDYTITVTSEGKVKTDAQTVRKQLHSDLKNVRAQVIAAKQAVANAIRTAKSEKGSSGEQ